MPFLRGREVIVEMRAEMIPKARFSRKCPRPRHQSAAGSEGRLQGVARGVCRALLSASAPPLATVKASSVCREFWWHCLGHRICKSLSGTGRALPREVPEASLPEALPEAIRSYARGAGQSGRVDK
jgi:hypothetical protein